MTAIKTAVKNDQMKLNVLMVSAPYGIDTHSIILWGASPVAAGVSEEGGDEGGSDLSRVPIGLKK